MRRRHLRWLVVHGDLDRRLRSRASASAQATGAAATTRTRRNVRRDPQNGLRKARCSAGHVGRSAAVQRWPRRGPSGVQRSGAWHAAVQWMRSPTATCAGMMPSIGSTQMSGCGVSQTSAYSKSIGTLHRTCPRTALHVASRAACCISVTGTDCPVTQRVLGPPRQHTSSKLGL